MFPYEIPNFVPENWNPRAVGGIIVGRNLTKTLQREPEAGQTTGEGREELEEETYQEILPSLMEKMITIIYTQYEKSDLKQSNGDM